MAKTEQKRDNSKAESAELEERVRRRLARDNESDEEKKVRAIVRDEIEESLPAVLKRELTSFFSEEEEEGDGGKQQSRPGSGGFLKQILGERG